MEGVLLLLLIDVDQPIGWWDLTHAHRDDDDNT